LLRFAANGSIDGAPMIFFGQEIGISGGTFGFSRYEVNFNKPIPHFKTFNALKPAWDDSSFALDQLYPVYSAIAQARHTSPALRSVNRFFLDQTAGGPHQNIFAVAKFERKNASPNAGDVVFAFTNLDRNNDHQGVFSVNQDTDGDGVNDYGIKANGFYNVVNIAAMNPDRRGVPLWHGSGPSGSVRGSELLANGISVQMNKVPTSDGAWRTAPYEAQYLKLREMP
jgi:hypothetical protein